MVAKDIRMYSTIKKNLLKEKTALKSNNLKRCNTRKEPLGEKHGTFNN